MGTGATISYSLLGHATDGWAGYSLHTGIYGTSWPGEWKQKQLSGSWRRRRDFRILAVNIPQGGVLLGELYCSG